MDKIISVQNITFAYTREEGTETVKAIDGVSFEIEPGSFTAIIGKNGSGKSTLAKNLNGLLLPTEGDILVADYNTKDDAHIWDVRQTAGMVFQNPDNQLVSAIVEDDVAFGPENLGVDPQEIRQRVDQLARAEDEWIRKAVKLLVSKAKLVAEPSSAMGVAAVLGGGLHFQPEQKVCFVLSGGNNDLGLLAQWLSQED